MDTSWNSPDPSQLRYDNCTLAARWATVAWHSEDVGLELTISMVRDGLSRYFNVSNTPDPGDGELVRWAMFWGKQPLSSPSWAQYSDVDEMTLHNQSGSDMVDMVARSMWVYVHKKCMDQACPLLGWQGVPDLAGRGVCCPVR